MNFTMIMSQIAWPFLLFCTLFFEVATTYQSYRTSLILAFSDARGALLVCILLPGALDSIRDRINSFFRMVSIWVFPQLNISLRVRVFIPGFLLTLLITSTFFFLWSPCGCFRHHSLQYLDYKAMCQSSLGMIKAYDMDYVVRVLAGFKLASLN